MSIVAVRKRALPAPRLHLAVSVAPHATSASAWVDLVLEAQRGQIDFVTLEDAGSLDPMLIAARVAPLTRGIGLVPVAATTTTEPFHVSTQVATIDHVSGGWAGWLAEVRPPGPDERYVTWPVPSDAFADAAEHIEVVRRLWDSWEDGAEIRDSARGRFVDRRRLHHIDFAGEHVRVRGPSITPRPPQGQPVVVALGRNADERRFAATAADVLLTPSPDPDALARVRTDGAPPRVLVDLIVHLDDDAGAAAERRARHGAGFAGTPGQLADLLLDWRHDGFHLRPAELPHDLHAITRGVVPELRRRGVLEPDDAARTLRERLGLAQPANRYAAA